MILGDVCDSCYGVTGLLHVDGVTLDCSSSDDARALMHNAENTIDESLGQLVDLECDDDADDNSLGDLEDILSDDEVVELENSEDELNEDQTSNHVSFCKVNFYYRKNYKFVLKNVSLKETSSNSSCDGDSVIYMGHRNTFKGVDELVVTAEESLCLQAAESAKSLELPVPQHASSYISFAPLKLKSPPPEHFVVETQIAPR